MEMGNRQSAPLCQRTSARLNGKTSPSKGANFRTITLYRKKLRAEFLHQCLFPSPISRLVYGEAEFHLLFHHHCREGNHHYRSLCLGSGSLTAFTVCFIEISHLTYFAMNPDQTPDSSSAGGNENFGKIFSDHSRIQKLLEDPELLAFRRAYLEQQNFELSRKYPDLLQQLRKTVTSDHRKPEE